MKTECLVKSLAWLALASTLTSTAPAADSTNSPARLSPAETKPLRLPEVLVTGRSEAPPKSEPLATQTADTSPAARARVQDGASLLNAVPGAAVVRNGPQTGIVQLRGLSGDRVKTLVNGMTLTPACPNHMDPPLHYAAPAAVDSLRVMAGVTPVSWGGDSIGGTVLVEPAAPRFAPNDSGLPSGGLGSFYRSSNDGYGFNADAGLADQRHSASYSGSWQTANDLRFPGGRVRDTGFETQQHDFAMAWKGRRGVFSTDGGFVRTRNAGTPALTMDMIEDDAWHVGLRYQGELGAGTVDSRFYYHTIEHLMDNYSLRTPGAMRMFSPATSDDLGGNLGFALPHGQHTFRAGTGFHFNRFNAYQQNAVTSAQQDTFNGAQRWRAGTYLEWQADWTERWITTLGIRNDTVGASTRNLNRWLPASAADAAAFNALDHDFVDANFDVTATARFEANDFSTFELAFARKNRAPSLLERFLWTPLSASAGQADGRSYLGNAILEPETSHQFAATAGFHGERWHVNVTPFYNLVSDYIQGTPINRLVGGLPVLQWRNVGRADLYGVDGSADYAFNDHLTARGNLSYVRGINRDNGDNLYRIAPLHGTVGLDHTWKRWKSSVEVALVARQDDVAAYNLEPVTPGYALLNLRTGYEFPRGLSVELGLENITDQFYTDHLGGINAVGGSDVPVGNRIPGAGRFVYVAGRVKF